MGLAATKQEAFWEACGFGHTERVKEFLKDETIDVNWVSYTHSSCAIHVAAQNSPQIVQILLSHHCNVNAKDDRGNIALHHAAMRGRVDIMEMLIKAGSYIDAVDKNNWTALHNAGYFCQPGAAKCLIEHEIDIHQKNTDERNALHETCRSQSEEEEGLADIARMLVEAGAEINLKSSDRGEADFTPLMFACYHGHVGVAKVLCELGCDINAQGSNSWTALHWATDRGFTDIIHVLLEAGADPLVEGPRGELAVHRAKHAEAVTVLRTAANLQRAKLGLQEEDSDSEEETRSVASDDDRVEQEAEYVQQNGHAEPEVNITAEVAEQAKEHKQRVMKKLENNKQRRMNMIQNKRCVKSVEESDDKAKVILSANQYEAPSGLDNIPGIDEEDDEEDTSSGAREKQDLPKSTPASSPISDEEFEESNIDMSEAGFMNDMVESPSDPEVDLGFQTAV